MVRLLAIAIFLAICGRASLAMDSIEEVLRESKAREAEAARLIPQLRGYDWFNRNFTFEHDSTVGNINFGDRSLWVQVRAQKPAVIDAAWWWNPLDSDKRPTLDWMDFKSVYDRASPIVARHRWLQEWKSKRRGRSVELHAYGKGAIPEPKWEIQRYVLSAWRDAGFRGRPEFRILARRPSGGWSTLYFSSHEARALITANFVYPADKGDKFWMSRMDFDFHTAGRRDETYSKFFVVDPDGKWELKTYSKALPGSDSDLPPR